MTDVREKAAVLALVHVTKGKRHVTASMIEETGSALGVLREEWSGAQTFDAREARILGSQVTPALVDEYIELIDRLQSEGVAVITILDREYPANLRDVYNRPPVLFVRGELLQDDERAVAVVGTRTPSPAGVDEARRLATELARRGVTVLSGLARGIDTAAHEAALGAGGRTIAVMGTGIRMIYPAENVGLAGRIAQRGALVSQFMPDFRPTRWSFPLRNAVMSGMSIGTAVIEAGPTSGAKIQAGLALEHGKRLFLVESLVSSQQWAQEFARHPGTRVVSSADEIVQLVETLTRPARELILF
jgi:DNA processing protein